MVPATVMFVSEIEREPKDLERQNMLQRLDGTPRAAPDILLYIPNDRIAIRLGEMLTQHAFSVTTTRSEADLAAARGARALYSEWDRCRSLPRAARAGCNPRLRTA